MSLDTVKAITELLRAARSDGVSDDPRVRAAFYERKAEVFDAIAKEPGPFVKADDAKQIADDARAEARALRALVDEVRS